MRTSISGCVFASTLALALTALAPSVAPAQTTQVTEPSTTPQPETAATDATRRPQGPAEEASSKPRTPGGVVTTQSKLLKIGGMIRGLYEYAPEFEGAGGRTTAAKSSFNINRARVELRGQLSEKIDYRVYVDFFYRGVGPQLLDANIRYRLMDPEVKIVVGQFQPVTLGEGKSNYWQFINAGNGGDTLRWGFRDRGIAARGQVWKRRITYSAQLVNGNGITNDFRGGNDNLNFRTAGMVKIEPLGPIPLYQEDLDRGSLRFGVGGAVAYSRDQNDDAAGAFCSWFLPAGVMGGRQPRKADKHAANQPNGADHTLAQTLKSSQKRRAALGLIVDHDPA